MKPESSWLNGGFWDTPTCVETPAGLASVKTLNLCWLNVGLNHVNASARIEPKQLQLDMARKGINHSNSNVFVEVLQGRQCLESVRAKS